MKMSILELKAISHKFLAILNREKIRSTTDLLEHLGKSYTYTNKDYVSITLRPSNFGTYAYTISYIRPGTGIPLEIKVNQTLAYSQIILKADEKIKDYAEFAVDPFGNFVQNKIIKSGEFDKSIEEIERLRDYFFLKNNT